MSAVIRESALGSSVFGWAQRNGFCVSMLCSKDVPPLQVTASKITKKKDFYYLAFGLHSMGFSDISAHTCSACSNMMDKIAQK